MKFWMDEEMLEKVGMSKIDIHIKSWAVFIFSVISCIVIGFTFLKGLFTFNLLKVVDAVVLFLVFKVLYQRALNSNHLGYGTFEKITIDENCETTLEFVIIICSMFGIAFAFLLESFFCSVTFFSFSSSIF